MFLDIPIALKSGLSRNDVLAWWPKEEVEQRAFNVQLKELKNDFFYPNYQGGMLLGELETLKALWAVEGDLPRQLALLKGAIIYSAMNSYHGMSNRYKPARYEDYCLVKKYLQSVYAPHQFPWRHPHTHVIPHNSSGLGTLPPVEDDQALSSFQTMLELDSLAMGILDKWQPVRIKFCSDEKSSAQVLAIFNATPRKLLEDQLELARAAEYQEQEHARRLKEQEREKLRKRHPRRGQWPLPPGEFKEQLEHQSDVSIAAMFGVSGRAVGKYRVKHNIPKTKPPRVASAKRLPLD